MRGNWQIGSLLGIPLYLDSSWFIILAFVTLLDAGEVNAQELAGKELWLGWLIGLVMALLLFGSVLLHELGHSLVARAQGISVNSITLFLFGGVASIERESKTPIGAFGIAIAGPLVSFTLFGLFSLLRQWSDASPLLQYVALDIARINLVLGVFNLIPGLPLDGGQVLKSIVWQVTGDRSTGIRWAATTGKVIGTLGIGIGLFLLLVVRDLSALWIAFVGLFIFRNAQTYDRLRALQESLSKIIAAEVMLREFRVVNAHLSVREFIETYLRHEMGCPMAYFATSEGRYRGLIRPSDLQSIERSEWDSKTLDTIAHPLDAILSVEEKTALLEVIQTLEQTSDRRLTVLSPAGAVAGVIDRGDIVRAIAVCHHLPIPDSEIQRIKAEGTYPTYLQLPAIVKTFQS